MSDSLEKPGFNPDRKYKIVGTSPVTAGPSNTMSQVSVAAAL